MISRKDVFAIVDRKIIGTKIKLVHRVTKLTVELDDYNSKVHKTLEELIQEGLEKMEKLQNAAKLTKPLAASQEDADRCSN